MSYALQAFHKEGYLHLLVTGENSPETLASFLGRCIEICRQGGQRTALVEDALTGPDVELGELFSIIGPACEKARNVVDLVCYVKTTPGHNQEIVRFAENIATIRAINVHVFRTVEEARLYIERARLYGQ